MASRGKVARTGIAVVGAAVTMMMAAAIPAGAEPASGKVDGGTDGYHVNVGKGKLKEISTSLIGFRLSDGTKLGMYCVEIHTNIDRKHEMVEEPWDSYPNADSPFHDNRDQINWILHHGFPVQSTDALSQLLTDEGAALNNGLSTREAIAATQAAVWHFSDDTNLNRKNPLPAENKKADADVLALYDYLTGDANVGIGDQPTPALEVSPTELSGTAGERIGPFTVSTTGEIDELTSELPDGVTITDADGAELDASMIENGTELYLDVPADATEGEATFELTASASVDTGRLFVGKEYDEKKTQSLIVAKAESSEITVTAGGSWAATPPPTTETTPPTSTETTAPPTTTTTEAAPVPQPKNTAGLAETGASILAPIVIGVVLLGAGVGSLLFLRHRRRA